MSYLLGFPTPIIEIIAVILGFFLSFAFYFGLRFEPVDMDTRNEESESSIEVNR